MAIPETQYVPRARWAELVEYARQREPGGVWLSLEFRQCEGCYHLYFLGDGGYDTCPACNEQPTALEELLRCPWLWPGPSFIWDRQRSRWVLVENLVLTDPSHFDALQEALPDAEEGKLLIYEAIEEIKSLRRRTIPWWKRVWHSAVFTAWWCRRAIGRLWRGQS